VNLWRSPAAHRTPVRRYGKLQNIGGEDLSISRLRDEHTRSGEQRWLVQAWNVSKGGMTWLGRARLKTTVPEQTKHTATAGDGKGSRGTRRLWVRLGEPKMKDVWLGVSGQIRAWVRSSASQLWTTQDVDARTERCERLRETTRERPPERSRQTARTRRKWATASGVVLVGSDEDQRWAAGNAAAGARDRDAVRPGASVVGLGWLQESTREDVREKEDKSNSKRTRKHSR
jgi:hypothetical protein